MTITDLLFLLALYRAKHSTDIPALDLTPAFDARPTLHNLHQLGMLKRTGPWTHAITEKGELHVNKLLAIST